jgi:methyltransferase-like protein
VYSWVPAEVRAKVLDICREQLAPQGVAYISFNTYPGWHIKGSLRDIMRYHTRQIEEPLVRAKEARRFLSFLAGAEPAPHGGAHALFLRAYAQYSRDHVVVDHEVNLLHDDLGEVNKPLYFHEFAEQLAGHGLRYLADADLSLMLASNLPPAVAEGLRRMVHNTIELEQYMDFLRNRAFRRALVCQEGVRLSLPVEVSRLAGLYVASGAEAETAGLEVGSASVEKFRISSGAALTTNHPVTKAALVHLGEVWPRSVRFDELLAAARGRLDGAAGVDAAEDGRVLAANLLKGYGYSIDLVELHSYAPRFVMGISRRPLGSPVARWQASRGPFVTNLRHELVTMDGLSHHLLPELDGSRDRAALLAMVEELAAQGELLAPAEEGQPASAIPPDRSTLAEILDVKLFQMAHSALLIG